MRVLSCIAAPYWGGLHVVVERTTPFFSAHGYARFVALPVADAAMRTRLEASGAQVIEWQPARPRKSLNPLEHLRYVWNFKRDVAAIRTAIRTHAIDLVEVAGLLNLQPVVAARLEAPHHLAVSFDPCTPAHPRCDRDHRNQACQGDHDLRQRHDRPSWRSGRKPDTDRAVCCPDRH